MRPRGTEPTPRDTAPSKQHGVRRLPSLLRVHRPEGRGGRRGSEGQWREECSPVVRALIPTPMEGHLINMRNNMLKERAARGEVES